MPADRSVKSSKRAGESAFQVMDWTAPPAEPAAPQTFSFAPNVTPVTFIEPPPSVEDVPAESTLFPSAFEEPVTSAPRRQTHGKKRAEDHIPRPPNAFILFRSSFIKSQHVSSEIEGNHGTLSKIVGLLWHNLPYEERQVWQAKARRALAEHKRRWPDYSFKPKHLREKDRERDTKADGGGGGGGTGKRKVREVGPRDAKRCERIATLLASGKKGDELAAAIEEFDRHRVPEIQTRFEAPLTARQYRRSSSAPLPDTENSKAQSAFVPSSPAPRKNGRSSSSRPQRVMTPQPQSLSRRPTLTIQTLPSDGSPWDSNSSWSSSVSTLSSPSMDFYPQKFESDPTFDFSGFTFSQHQSGCTTPASDCFSPFEVSPSPTSDENALGVFFTESYHTEDCHVQQQPLSAHSTVSAWGSEFDQSPMTPITAPATPHDRYPQPVFNQYSAPTQESVATYQLTNYGSWGLQEQQQMPDTSAFSDLSSSAPSSEYGDFGGDFQFDDTAADASKFAVYAQQPHQTPFDLQNEKFGFELAQLDPELSRFMSSLPRI
ncbi:hypothetical protein BD410DRAFT_801461 [Rickenella mellea]|uniref:HMG box domain-containing protein n=1 Tax=Rickenella mellea TaxID=50990 RepID=A0A4Y7QE17_9AGAM|nr:hypothetical protein BD410DRAFT_801461 [Rickenella mellea]